MSAQKNQEKIYYNEEGMDAPKVLPEDEEVKIIVGSERKIRQLRSEKKEGEQQHKCSGQQLGKSLFSKSKQQKSQGSSKKQNLFERGNGVNILAQNLDSIKPIMQNLKVITNVSAKKQSDKTSEPAQKAAELQQNDPQILKPSQSSNENKQQIKVVQTNNASSQAAPIQNQVNQTNIQTVQPNQSQPISQSIINPPVAQAQPIQTISIPAQIPVNIPTNPQDPLSRKSTQADENENNNIPSQTSASKTTNNIQHRSLAQ